MKIFSTCKYVLLMYIISAIINNTYLVYVGGQNIILLDDQVQKQAEQHVYCIIERCLEYRLFKERAKLCNNKILDSEVLRMQVACSVCKERASCLYEYMHVYCINLVYY